MVGWENKDEARVLMKLLEENVVDEEVSQLIRLAYDKSSEGRTSLFTSITNQLQEKHKDLSLTESRIMSDILGSLIHHVEMNIRQKLAEKLAGNEDAPIDLILLLANDQIEVASPILKLSNLLDDNNLIKIIRHKTIQHQLNITARKDLSSNVTRELITTGNDEVVIKLLNNHDAKIENSIMADLVGRSRKNLSLQPPLVERPDLPRAMALKMYLWISESLKDRMVETQSLDQREIEQAISSTLDDLHEEDEISTSQLSSEQRLVDKLHDSKLLKSSFLMKSLNQGKGSLFEIAFAKMVNIPRDFMCGVLYDKGPDALAVACCAVNIDQSVFLTIYRLTRKARDMETEISDEETQHAFNYFQKMDSRRAQITLHKWVAEEARSPIF